MNGLARVDEADVDVGVFGVELFRAPEGLDGLEVFAYDGVRFAAEGLGKEDRCTSPYSNVVDRYPHVDVVRAEG